MVLAILAALQTREELAEEILAAARATEARGSYEIRLDQTSSQAMGAGGQEHAIEVRMDATGAWQSPNLLRMRATVTPSMGGTPLPGGGEAEFFAAGARMWELANGTWTLMDLPANLAPINGLLPEPAAFFERLVGAGQELRRGEAEEVDGTACRSHVAALAGQAVVDFLTPAGTESPVRIDADGAQFTVTIFQGEADRVIRKVRIEATLRMTSTQGTGGSMSNRSTATQTWSRHGDARVEVPEPLAGEIRREE